MIHRIVACTLSLALGTVIAPRAQAEGVADAFDDFVAASIALAQALFYGAEFEEAEKFLQPERFEGSELVEEKHLVALVSQASRIRIVRNRVRQQTSDQEGILANLLDLSAAARGLKDRSVYADFQYTLGMAYLYNTDTEAAGASYGEALRVYEELGDDHGAAMARAWLTWVATSKLYSSGAAEQTVDLIPVYEEEIAFAEKAKNPLALSFNTRHLANIYLFQLEDFDRALELYQTSLALREEVGFLPYLPASLSSIGDVLAEMGDIEGAIAMYAQSIIKAESIGFVRYQIFPRLKIGDLYRSAANHERAREHYTAGLEVASNNQYSNGIEEARKRLDGLREE